MKVFLLADRPNRNGVEFWNLLGKQCDLTVAFERYPEENKLWEFSTVGNSFKSVFLQGISYGKKLNVPFGIGKLVNENAYDVFVLEDCITSAQKASIKELIFNRKKFLLACEGGFPNPNESDIAKRAKASYIKNACLYLSCGSACDAYLGSYGADMNKIIRYDYAAFSEKDYTQATPMTEAREQGLKRRYRLKDNIFISTIHFSEKQGIDLLLEMWKFAGIQNASLLIISDAKAQKKLSKMVRSLALNDVVMLDYQPLELTRELIRISRAFIYPARHDVWGMPVVEALSCGVPVISSYSTGVVHDLVINNKTGFVRSINEPISWGEGMREMLNRDILYNKMKKEIIHSMRTFTIESRVKSYIDAFRQCAIMQNK